MAYQGAGKVYQRFRHGASLHDFSRHDKEGDGQKRKGIECVIELLRKNQIW